MTIYAPTEKEFMSTVLDLAVRCNWRVYHTFDSRRSHPGWPDLVFLRPPDALFVELKTESGKLTDIQEAWLRDLRACGLDARVWRPADWDTEITVALRKKAS